ncbi:TNT domain-containing protein [Actinophytocola sp.]|uniref:TNT domain-containing protein n=1 Tax=Actinophytocola sp. TaxID=1872138 RepID=UPI002ED62CB7
MTRPTPLGIEGQRELTRKIADLLVVRAPADREQIRVMYRATGSHEEVVGHILGIDGQLRDWELPPELPEFYRQLRAGMYKEGVGTWTAASTIVEYPIKTTVDYRDETRWRKPPPRWAVLDELEMFPRTPDRVANWMKTVLPNAERVAEVAGRFRRARIFDHRGPDGRPVVDRPPVPEAELQQVVKYLTTAHVVMGGRGYDPDVFDPEGTPDVPAAYLTDGTWIWTASVPHYLTKHGVPPEPDLVAHIRANGFTPPQPDEATKDAAYLALTGEIPEPRPQHPAQQAPAEPAPAAPTELSDVDRRVLAIIERRVSEAGAIPRAYEILGPKEGAICLERVDDEWQVAMYERGKAFKVRRFDKLWDAGAYLLGSLTISPSNRRLGGSDRNTAQALNDWPIQPLPTEPPLTLLTEKHIAVLMPGREVIRYGEPTGNLTFADNTEFTAMSLRPDREQQGPRRYRVQRELHTLSGVTVPWHNQPGGGTAYLLPKAVEDHIADGSLTEVTG